MKNWGVSLIIIGIICGNIAITMDTSVESGGTYEYGIYIPKMKVNNIGLMNQQTNLLIGAGIAFISGILLIGFNSKSGSSSSGEIRTCPYCAEQVKAQATICRFCQKDLPVLSPDSPDQVRSPLLDESLENLPQQIRMLRNEGLSYHLIAQDFNEKNVSIPQWHKWRFETWTLELVKLIERESK